MRIWTLLRQLHCDVARLALCQGPEGGSPDHSAPFAPGDSGNQSGWDQEKSTGTPVRVVKARAVGSFTPERGPSLRRGSGRAHIVVVGDSHDAASGVKSSERKGRLITQRVFF